MKNSIVPAGPSPEPQFPALAGAGGSVAYSERPGGTPGGPGEEEGGDFGSKLRRYFAAVRRFKWIVLLLVILGTVAGVFLTRFTQVMYEANGRMWIGDVSEATQARNKNSVLLANGSWLDVFRSHAVVDRVVDREHLWYRTRILADSNALTGMQHGPHTFPGDYTITTSPNGNYTLSEAKRGLVERGTVGGQVGRSIGLIWTPTAAQLGTRSIGFWVTQPWTVAVSLMNRVDLLLPEASNVLKIGLTGTNGAQTASIVNTWMDEFVAKGKQLRVNSIQQSASDTKAQRDEALSALYAAEGQLEKTRARTITEPGGGGGAISAAGPPLPDALSANYFQNKTLYENVKNDRESLERIAAEGRSGALIADAVSAIPSVDRAPELQAAIKDLVDREAKLRALQAQFTDAYPQVIQAKSEVQQIRTVTIPRLADNSAAVLRSRENQLSSMIRRDSVRLTNIPALSLEGSRRARDVANAEQSYNAVEKAYQEMELAAANVPSDLSVLDRAQATLAPQRNLKALLVMGGFMGSLGFAIFLALMLDMFDHRFRYPEQIADELKLTVIGAVPAVPKASDAMSDPEAMLHSIEAFRGLRMRIHHAYATPPVMLTITSPGAGDGKSMIASNLALSFAEAGYRTLLIDGDIRRGKVHSVFGVDRRPGLLDYLAGEVELAQILRTVSSNGLLTVIPSGTRRHRGPELLTSARLPALFNTMRSRYDVILVDSAPLGAGIDGYALGVVTGNMVLVMRTGVTDRRVAKAKLKLLNSFPVRMIGAIVNDVPAKGLYQEYSYLYGYAPDIDTDAGHLGEIPVLRADTSIK